VTYFFGLSNQQDCRSQKTLSAGLSAFGDV